MSPPLRIALLTHSTNPRGGVVHALAVAEALTDLGHTAVVHAPDPAGRGFFRPARCGTVSVPAGSVAGLDTAAMVERRIADYAAFFQESRHRGYDLYHAQDGIGGNALADLHAAGLVPGFLRTVHHLDAFAEPALAARQRRGVAEACAVICVSDLWRDILRRDFGLEAHRADNGVDRSVFSPRPGRRDDEIRRHWGLGAGPLVLSVGGFEARKNTLAIIEAFAALRRDRPSAQWLVVGGASVLDHADYARRCEDALARHGLDVGLSRLSRTGPRESASLSSKKRQVFVGHPTQTCLGAAVVRTGPVPQDDMPAFYRLAETLVFPSVSEGFGLAVIEALASGTPAIVSRIAPFTEYLGAEDALWVDPADPGSIEAALRDSLDPRRRGALARRGHAVAARFDWEVCAQRHLDVYRMVRSEEPALA